MSTSTYNPVEVFVYPALLAPGETVRDGSSGEPMQIGVGLMASA